MLEVFEVDQCKQMDKQSIIDIGIPSIILMENAALGIFNEIVHIGELFLILCGKGNNGGDALALSRHLILAGKKVKVYIISSDKNFTPDFQTNFNIVKNLINEEDLLFISSENDVNAEIAKDLEYYSVIVDGIFGVGLNKDLTGMYKKIIEYINLFGKFIVSIDVPSGLDSNLGVERGIAVHADVTYTFEVVKKGFLNYEAIDCIGRLEIVEIGIPKDTKKGNTGNIYILEKNEYKQLLPKREKYGHKGSYGRALIVAGRRGFSGAAFITTECTVRTGAGLTTLICDEEVERALGNRLVEAMTLTWKDDFINLIKNADSIAFGPGIGTGNREEDLLNQVIHNSRCPIVIDADGITLLGKNKALFTNLHGRAIITPHPGEMARFLGRTVEEVEANRIEIAKEVASNYGIIVLLKGYNTVISNGKEVYINPTGNSKMASGGMGDALTGVINGFLSQGINIEEAALLGAYVHGRIGDRLGENSYIVNARDIINELPKEINNIYS
jgi:NAD(P)H-hydrate epimerase